MLNFIIYAIILAAIVFIGGFFLNFIIMGIMFVVSGIIALFQWFIGLFKGKQNKKIDNDSITSISETKYNAKICPNCNKEIINNAKFCKNCGVKINK